jgi:hypothetical protein
MRCIPETNFKKYEKSSRKVITGSEFLQDIIKNLIYSKTKFTANELI